MTYIHNLIKGIGALGVQIDKTENAILDGDPNQTISMRDAIANLHKRLWAHFACMFLSIAVQWNHCADQIAGKPMSALNHLRAIIALIGVPFALIYGVIYLAHMIWIFI